LISLGAFASWKVLSVGCWVMGVEGMTHEDRGKEVCP
jgi:hypothetical protein